MLPIFLISSVLAAAAAEEAIDYACLTHPCPEGTVCVNALPAEGVCVVAPCDRSPICVPPNSTCQDYPCPEGETCEILPERCFDDECPVVVKQVCKKYPKCPPHEEYNECSRQKEEPPCEPHCFNYDPYCANNTCGEGACECKFGYRRHEGVCILPDVCPDPPCPTNQAWSKCPRNNCAMTCRKLYGNETAEPCPEWCGYADCVCKPGFVRDDDDECIQESACLAVVQCDVGEEFVECSSAKEWMCDDRERGLFVPKHIPANPCGPPKCQCRNGWARDGDRCMLAGSCPQE